MSVAVTNKPASHPFDSEVRRFSEARSRLSCMGRVKVPPPPVQLCRVGDFLLEKGRDAITVPTEKKSGGEPPFCCFFSYLAARLRLPGVKRNGRGHRGAKRRPSLAYLPFTNLRDMLRRRQRSYTVTLPSFSYLWQPPYSQSSSSSSLCAPLQAPRGLTIPYF